MPKISALPDGATASGTDTTAVVQGGVTKVVTVNEFMGARTVASGAGLTGGGTLAADKTLAVGAGTGITVNADDVALDTTHARNADHSAVSVIAGSGLTGGGTIAADRTLAVGAGTGIAVNPDDVALAAIGAYTFLGNNTGSIAAPAAVDISAVTEKTTLANDDLFLIQDSAASNAYKRVKRSSFSGVNFAPLDFYRNPGLALSSGITAATYSAPGAAFSASAFRFSASAGWLFGRQLKEVRWLVAWTPGHAANATFLRLTHFTSGPANITQIAEITAVGTSPRTDAVDVTASLQALLDAGFEGFLGNEHKGNGTQAPSVYLSTLEIYWK